MKRIRNWFANLDFSGFGEILLDLIGDILGDL